MIIVMRWKYRSVLKHIHKETIYDLSVLEFELIHLNMLLVHPAPAGRHGHRR